MRKKNGDELHLGQFVHAVSLLLSLGKPGKEYATFRHATKHVSIYEKENNRRKCTQKKNNNLNNIHMHPNHHIPINNFFM